jgi:hypothetical protein
LGYIFGAITGILLNDWRNIGRNERKKENNIIVTSGEVKNMEYPVVQIQDIENDTRDDLILMHEHTNNPSSGIQEV